MKIVPTLAFALILLLPSLAGGGPPSDVKIAVFVTTVKQESPLQILGFKPPDKVGGAPILVVKNVSDKPVSDFYVSAAIGNPEGDSRGEVGPAYATGSGMRSVLPEERPIPPNSEREAHETAFRSHYLAHWGAELHSTCLHVAAIVLSVKFADGTAWRLEGQQDQEIWKSSLPSDSTKGCDHSPAAEAALKDWDGPSGNAETGSPSHLPAGTVQSYSFACPLRNLDGKLVAVCPW